MANRSYLFASPIVPGDGAATKGLRGARGLSESAHAIPLVFRILVSVDVRRCPSMIWRTPETTALAGRCGHGIDRLARFLGRIDHPAIAPLRDEALESLSRRADRDGHLVLECAEILDMDEAPLEEQAAALLRGVQNIDAEIESTLLRLVPARKNFWERVFTPSQQSIDAPLRDLGLGHWSTTLYHSPADET